MALGKVPLPQIWVVTQALVVRVESPQELLAF